MDKETWHWITGASIACGMLSGTIGSLLERRDKDGNIPSHAVEISLEIMRERVKEIGTDVFSDYFMEVIGFEHSNS